MHPERDELNPPPVWNLPSVPEELRDRLTAEDLWHADAWSSVAAVELTLSDGSGAPRQATRVQACWDAEALYVRFVCADQDAWSHFTRRDDSLWEQEAVEVFLAPGAAAPQRYFEFQVSPRGVLFDAVVDNPNLDRSDLVTDPSWNCPGIRWAAGPLPVSPGSSAEAAQGTSSDEGPSEDWWAGLLLPWRGLLPDPRPPTELRANFYRIERPRPERFSQRPSLPEEFSAWSPTNLSPPDFHRPARFGLLRLVS
ncbi:MAG: carbohydrate-binding family 9-like protein [Acidobacteriota bacterium]|nr:carbohydrate-binding family 9-like protein [Acidobacteriota bacterium]